MGVNFHTQSSFNWGFNMNARNLKYSEETIPEARKEGVIIQCICCEKVLQPAFDGNPYQPAEGLICFTEGNFGSREFDPIDQPAELIFFVCDTCLVAKQEKVFHLKKDQKDLVPWKQVREQEDA